MIAIVLLCAACAAYMLWKQKNSRSDEPPLLPGAWPIIGHALNFIGNSRKLWLTIRDCAERSYPLGGVVAGRIGPRTVYIVTDPDDMFTVANTCLEKDDFYDFAKPWLGEGLVTGKCGRQAHGSPDGKWLPWPMDVCNTSGVTLALPTLKKPSNALLKGPYIIVAWENHSREFIPQPERAWDEVPFIPHVSIWRNHRKILNPAFSQVVLDRFMGVFNSQSKKLVDALDKEVGKGSFDHWMYTRSNALETICLTVMGVDFTDSLLNTKYFDAAEFIFNSLVERFTKIWWHSAHTFRFSLLKKRQDDCLKIVHKLSDTVLQKRKTEFVGNTCAERSIIPGTRFKALMDLLLELSLEKGVLNDKEIREHVDTMIVGGHDTSANVLMYTMLLLGAHPEVQAKVYTELREVLGDGDRDVEKQDLSQLVYLEAVIKESMRIYTIVPVLARKLDKNVKLKNCTLQAGRTCFMFVFGLHRHPVWGPDRNQFSPERWLDPSRLPENPNAFAAFSFGRRMCIGKMYAMMSMKTTLAHLMRRYRITADDSQLLLRMEVMLKPVAGYYINIERRI